MQSDFEAKLWATFPLLILSHRRFDFRPYPSYLFQDATTRSLEKPLILLQDLHLHSLNISGQFTLKALCLLIRLGTRIFTLTQYKSPTLKRVAGFEPVPRVWKTRMLAANTTPAWWKETFHLLYRVSPRSRGCQIRWFYSGNINSLICPLINNALTISVYSRFKGFSLFCAFPSLVLLNNVLSAIGTSTF